MTQVATQPAPTNNALHPSTSTTVPLFGVISLASAFCVQLMLTAFVAWGRLSRPRKNTLFSYRAWLWFHPERDIPIYVAGTILTLAIIALSCWGWIRWTKKHATRIAGPRQTTENLTRVATIQVAIAIAGLIAYLTLLSFCSPVDSHGRRPVMGIKAALPLVAISFAPTIASLFEYRLQIFGRRPRLLVWAGPALLALSIIAQLIFAPLAMQLAMALLVTVIWYWMLVLKRENPERWKLSALQRSGIFAAMALGSFLIYLNLSPSIEPSFRGALLQDPLNYRGCIPVFAMAVCILLDTHWGSARRTDNSKYSRVLCDIAVSAVLCAAILIPHSRWTDLAGSFFQNDELHHWNYFSFGPAIAFAHGHALISEVYSQYGVAWPFLFSVLRHWVKLSYANFAGYGIICGCGYFLGVYLFIRLLLREPIWAASGVILAVLLQVYSGIGGEGIIWNAPSSTVLRHPVDILLFLALLGHCRFGNGKWIVAAGAVCGLAVLFELDTGIDLILIFGFYWLLVLCRKTDWREIRSWDCWAAPVGAAAMALLVWVAGMTLASRGTILRRLFWSEYFEGLHNQAFSGFSMLPIANVNGFGMAIFAGMLVVYFFAIGSAGARIWSGTSSEIDVFLAPISAYGLGLLLLFVGRSHPSNLFHPMVPLAIVIVALLHDFRANTARDLRWTSFPWVLAAGTLAILCTKPEFTMCPSLLEQLLIRSPDRNGPLALSSTDLSGFPLSQKRLVNDTQLVVKAIRLLPVHDQEIAILDDRDTLLCYLSDRSPWSRYTSIFHGMLTRTMISKTQRELVLRHPRYIVIRSAPPPMTAMATTEWEFTDLWTIFHHLAARRYHLEKTVGGYDFWRLGHEPGL
jgi:hypothetical protein